MGILQRRQTVKIVREKTDAWTEREESSLGGAGSCSLVLVGHTNLHVLHRHLGGHLHLHLDRS